MFEVEEVNGILANRHSGHYHGQGRNRALVSAPIGSRGSRTGPRW